MVSCRRELFKIVQRTYASHHSADAAFAPTAITSRAGDASLLVSLDDARGSGAGGG